jgi:hypothetical protein
VPVGSHPEQDEVEPRQLTEFAHEHRSLPNQKTTRLQSIAPRRGSAARSALTARGVELPASARCATPRSAIEPVDDATEFHADVRLHTSETEVNKILDV